MAGVSVDPPPINHPIVDTRTGKPTRPFVEFLHRMWKRTGGEQDAIEAQENLNAFTLFNPGGPYDPESDQVAALSLNGSGGSPEQLEEAMNDLAAMIAAQAPAGDILAAIEDLRSATLASVKSCNSEVGELRAEVESLKQIVVSMSFIGTRSYTDV